MAKKNFSEAVNLDMFFSQAEQQAQKEDPVTIPAKKNKIEKKVFSFRVPASDADQWRLWANAAGMKVDELGEAAMREYIKRHPLTPDQETIFRLQSEQKKK